MAGRPDEQTLKPDLSVKLGTYSYPVIIGPGALNSTAEAIGGLGGTKKCMLVTNPTVMELYGNQLLYTLSNRGWEVVVGTVDDSEEAKSIGSVCRLWDLAVQHQLERWNPFLALGGGVVGDIAGFAAATYKRGVPLVHIPTTLLAQVDSAIGGKNGINHALGKNLIGTFYQPRMVLVDPTTIKSLPRRELVCGLAEVIKYGVIDSQALFTFLEEHLDQVLEVDLEVIEAVIRESVAIKSKIVSADEMEMGLRAVLNFGHTVGHALESATGYGHFHHGEAVAIGMAEESRMAVRLGIFPADEAERLITLLGRAGLPTSIPNGISPEELLLALQQDKKNREGKVTVVMPKRLGEVSLEQIDGHRILGMLV